MWAVEYLAWELEHLSPEEQDQVFPLMKPLLDGDIPIDHFYDAFFSVVRQGHPEVPVLAISPILRANAEATPNRLGATLADLREAFETLVGARIAAGDSTLYLVAGLPLVAADRFPDGIHPDDEGHAALAPHFGKARA